MVRIKFQLNESLYLRDPQDTDLGRNILRHSVLLIDAIGFEQFTFKKLATEIQSTEKSIYRYFDNKHLLLLFLTSWYWEWVSYLISINSNNIEDPNEKLEVIIKNIVYASAGKSHNEYINERVLHRVIINEGSKSYHTHLVDDENKVGLFSSYKSLVSQVAEVLASIDPTFPYPISLASNLFEMANSQIYFAQHLPKMTNIDDTVHKEIDLIKMLTFFAKKLLKKEQG